MPLFKQKWQLDNFYKPEPFMDLPRNLHDCYFFYYSTCQKGINCDYRHEPAALGHEETCKMWLEGKCYNRQCTMRHMKIEKPRSATPCYWEDQPGGCRKPHCVFQHKMPKLPTTAATNNTAVIQLQPLLLHRTPGAVPVDYSYPATVLPRII